jgi:hypothetical protein
VIIIGDVHGKIDQYRQILNNLDKQPSIQIGDMGIGFQGVHLKTLPNHHRFFRGNHDNPAKCRAHPNYLGDYGYLKNDRIFYLAGAFSIDAAWRVPGVSWWVDEELDYTTLMDALKLYESVKPEFVISHEAPSTAAAILLADLVGPYFGAKADCSKSRTSEVLQQMFDVHQPKEWVFGHYHVSKSFVHKGTKFTCVPELGQYTLNTGDTNE